MTSSVPRVRVLAVCLVLAGIAAAPTAFTADSTTSKGNAALGKQVFTKTCVVCHKANGSGGMKLTGNPTPNWRDAKVWADPKRTDDFLRDCIVNGNVKSGMVAFGKSGQLKPADIENVIAYIKTFKPANK